MNLFIITSPFQYICALEARNHFQCKKNILVVIEQDTESGKEQQEKLLNHLEWDKVILAPRANRKKTTCSLIKRLKSESREFDMLFFSEFNSWRTRAFTSNLQATRYIHLDDGTMTLVDFESIEKEKPKNKASILKNIYLKTNKLNTLKTRLKSELFTIFNLESNNIKIHNNELKNLNTGQGIFDAEAPIGIVGQGGIGDKRKISEEEYIEKIRSISAKECKRIIYFPHRTEKESTKEKIKKIDGIVFHNSKYPLEIELTNEEIKISKLITTISTAIFTLKKIDRELPIYTVFDDDNLSEVPTEIRTELKKLGITKIH